MKSKSPLRYKLFAYIAKRMGYFVSLRHQPNKQFIITKVTGTHD